MTARPHLSQTLRHPSTQRMPSLVGASKLKVSFRKAAGNSSFFVTRSDRVTSRPRLGWAAPLVTLGPAWATSCSQGSRMGPVLTLQGLLIRPGSWAGGLSGPLSSSSPLVTSEGAGRGGGSRQPGLAASCQEEGVGGPRPCLHLRPPRPASHIPARGRVHCPLPQLRGQDTTAGARWGLLGWGSNQPPVKDILRPGGRPECGPVLALHGSFVNFASVSMTL